MPTFYRSFQLDLRYVLSPKTYLTFGKPRPKLIKSKFIFSDLDQQKQQHYETTRLLSHQSRSERFLTEVQKKTRTQLENKRRKMSLEDDEIISDDWSDTSDVAVEIETLKKGKKNSSLLHRRSTDLNIVQLNHYYFSKQLKNK